MPKKKNTVRSDGRIAVQVYLGRQDGKRKYKTVYGATQAEADKKAMQIKLELKRGIDPTSANDTFKDWADNWLAIQSVTATEKKIQDYKCCINKFSSLFYCPISKLKPIDFQKIISDLTVNNKNTGKPASKKTLSDTKSAAERICQLAVDNRVMDYNPVSSVNISSLKTPELRRALTLQEQQWIQDTPHRAQTAAMIMMYAGLRRGEIIPLTWDDIDLENKVISINKTVYMDSKGLPVIKNTAKSKAGIRPVYIPQILIQYLSAQPRTKGGLVCPSAKGTMLSSSAWERLWNSYLADLNLKYGDFSHLEKRPKSKFDPNGVPFVIPKFTAHCLRHTYATTLHAAEVDVLTAKELLGHSDVKTTLNIYTHLDQAHKIKNINKLNDYLDNRVESNQINEQQCKSNASH